jgi:hypothetical protein
VSGVAVGAFVVGVADMPGRTTMPGVAFVLFAAMTHIDPSAAVAVDHRDLEG